MNNPSETSKPSMESGDGNTGKKRWSGAWMFADGIEQKLKAEFLYELIGTESKTK